MIINQLSAENLLKYARLELRNLPSPGVIGISGNNESGKSAIGETICFALFGRTFSLAHGEFLKLIRWGESRCKVLLDFTLGEDRYELARYVDDEGNEGGYLSLVGRDSPLATGKKHVEQALKDLLGFGFEEFTESFYLAQREITTPQAHGAAVKAMAGIAQLEAVSQRLDDEIRLYEQDIAETERNIADIKEQATDLGFNEQALAALEHELAEVSDKMKQEELRHSEFDEEWNRWQQTKSEIRDGTEGLLAASSGSSLQQWREALRRVGSCVDGLHEAVAGSDKLRSALAGIEAFADELSGGLCDIDALVADARVYRSRLAPLLSEIPSSHPKNKANDTSEADEPAAARRGRLEADRGTQERRQRRAHLGFGVSALLALTVGSVWVLLDFMPEAAASRALGAWLAQNVAGWEAVYRPFLPAALGALAVLGIIFLLRAALLGSRIRKARADLRALAHQEELARMEAEAVDALETTPLKEAVAKLEAIDDEQLIGSLASFRESHGIRLLDEDAGGVRTVLPSLLAKYKAAVDAETKQLASQKTACRREIDSQEARLASLKQNIESEHQAQKTASALSDVSANLEAKVGELREHIDERQLARELVGGAGRSISKRFNRELRNVAADILPLLTKGRYEHLQIDEQLRVRAFSNEKRDFMALEEISIGTQRQIMLAIRLAMSKELIGKTHGKSQFLFLDEPFAFFDEERMKAALEALPELREHFAQVWVTAQHFPLGTAFDTHVECSSDMRELMVVPA